jgi:hypothetical protein
VTAKVPFGQHDFAGTERFQRDSPRRDIGRSIGTSLGLVLGAEERRRLPQRCCSMGEQAESSGGEAILVLRR